MGLLSQGRPLDWEETKKYAKYVQERGIAQFINIYKKSKDRADAPFKWGDEVEYIIVKFDHKNRKTRVSLKADEVFRDVAEQAKDNMGPPRSFWNPEFAAYMVEGTPGLPFGGDGLMLYSLCDIEESMRFRRQEVQNVLESDETVMSLTSYPRLGCPDFTHPTSRPQPETSASGSLFFPDEAIYNGHPRFKTLVKNIRSRRRRKVIINLPIFRDTQTPNPFLEMFTDPESKRAMKPNHVYMDAMGFGMGCCCLQITMQATHLEEAKVLYDQLAPLTPIALALSAASPIYRGYLTDRDCRWEVISRSVDDRTKEESNETKNLKDSLFRIPKSRYDSISCYLSRHGQRYNDLPLVFDQKYYDLMVANMVDPAVARHIAHLFIRDPITLYKEKLEQSDQELDHFENIQSTNWQTMRFKPPPAVDSPIGWRVEFRPLEAQTTDFENAAFVVFITLLSRVILAYKLNFLMPLSLVDENMIEAQKRDAIKNSKFWFKTDISHRCSSKEPLSTVLENCSNNSNTNKVAAFGSSTVTASNYSSRLRGRSLATATGVETIDDNDCKKMTINEIINGCEDFVGVLPIVWHYVESLDDGSNSELITKIKQYLRLISNRASLKVKTTARWMRDFVQSHPKYCKDSVVNDEVAYDLLHVMDKLGRSEIVIPDLLGNNTSSNEAPFVACCSNRSNSSNNQQTKNPGSSQTANATPAPNNLDKDGQVRKSTTLCNGFGSSFKNCPFSRSSRQSSEHNNRSMSR